MIRFYLNDLERPDECQGLSDFEGLCLVKEPS